uniref:Mutator-like transposase domain-containing protein n=1 Tax=Graphocephala atropunctata TaxID=36148 RepID=A0A1B6KE61_9HEMI
MCSRLRNLKQKMGKGKLGDGKTLGGRGRLTNAAINEIQNYYGLAIRRNVHSLDSMKTAVWAEYFHLGSSNESPAHSMCPKGADSCCKYQKAKANKETYDHKQHIHYPEIVMLKIKPIFQD